MEVSALPSPSFTHIALAEARAPRIATESAPKAKAAVPREDMREAMAQTASSQTETHQAIQQARQEEAIHAASGGSIQFEQEEGTRVMKVLDSKDVLIYQVPPKGRLTLIKAEEAATQALASA